MSDFSSTDSTRYRLFHNQDSQYLRTYLPGDRLSPGYSGELVSASRNLFELAQTVFVVHNRDDRPDGRDAPSLSVGDVVVFGECAVSVAAVGFVVVELQRGDIS
jgi:hypothetical protein